MLNRRHILAAAIGLAASPARSQTATPVPVVATFSILGDLARQIGGERIRLTSLVGPNRDAHGFEPGPKEARLLQGASLLIANGLGFDGWADRLATASGYKGPKLIATRGVSALSVRGSVDPHAWQDVANVRIYAANIRDGLIAVDPTGAAIYTRRTDALLAQLSALDGEIRSALAAIPKPRRRIVTSHDAFNYFADAYDVIFFAPQGVSTEAEPSAQDVARLITQIRSQDIRAIFIENLSNGRVIQQVSRETGVRIGGTLYSDALGSGAAATYQGMMRQNLRTMISALR